MELHNRVRYLRTEILNNMSQDEFAKILRVTRDEINNIEGNRLKHPEKKESLLLLMCSKFGVSENWLLRDIGEPVPSSVADEAAYVSKLLMESDNPFCDVIKAIMKTYSECSPENKAIIKAFAQSFIENTQKRN